MVILGEGCWGYNGVFGVKRVLWGVGGEKRWKGVEGVLVYNGVFGCEKGVGGIMGVRGTNGML